MSKKIISNVALCVALAGGIEHGVTAEKEQVKNRPLAGDASYSTPGRNMLIGVRVRGGQAPLKVEFVRLPEHGKVVVKRSSGRLKYSPSSGFACMDSFTCRVIDASGVQTRRS